MKRVHRLAILQLTSAIATALAPSLYAQIYYVGDQSTAKDNRGTASWHDGNNWLNFGSPGGVVGTGNFDADGPGIPGNGYADFDIATDHRPNNVGNPPPDPTYYGRPTYIYFGDFFDDRTISSDKLVPGGIARPSYVHVTTGEYTFDTGSNNGGATGGLDIVPPQDLSGLVVGGNHAQGRLNIVGGGMVHTRSARAGDSASSSGLDSTGIIEVRGQGTTLDVEGYFQIGSGSTSGRVVFREGAIGITRPIAGTTDGGIALGNEAGHFGELIVDTGAQLHDTVGIAVVAPNRRFIVRGGAHADTTFLIATGGGEVIVDGNGSRLEVQTSGFALSGGLVSVTNGASLIVNSAAQLHLGGTFSLDEGTVEASSINLGAAGSITGSGTIVGDVTASGRISPGHSPGLLTVDGNLQLASSGLIAMEIGGTVPSVGYDQLIATGNIDLLGEIQVSFVNGFVPSPGTEFELLTAGGFLNGTNARLNVVGAPAGWRFDVSSDSNSLSLIVLQVPEPTTAALITLMCAAHLPRRIRLGHRGGNPTPSPDRPVRRLHFGPTA